MKTNLGNINMEVKEAIAYYILGYEKYHSLIKEIRKKHWIIIIKFVLEMARDEVNTKEVISKNEELLNNILFKWQLNPDDFLAYATCIFYVLTNREKEITPEKIVTEFLSEVHSHHPRRTLKEANFILDELFPEE